MDMPIGHYPIEIVLGILLPGIKGGAEGMRLRGHEGYLALFIDIVTCCVYMLGFWVKLKSFLNVIQIL
jgi:hypothetical protein